MNLAISRENDTPLPIYFPRELVELILTHHTIYKNLRELNRACKQLVDKLLMPLRAKHRFTIKITQYENSATRKLVKTTNKLPNGNLNGEITKLSFDTNGTFCVQEWWLDGEPLREFGYYYEADSSNWWVGRTNSYISYAESFFRQFYCCYRDIKYHIEFDSVMSDKAYLRRSCDIFELTENETPGGYEFKIESYAMSDYFLLTVNSAGSKWWEMIDNEYYLLGLVLERYPEFLCGVYWDEDPVAAL